MANWHRFWGEIARACRMAGVQRALETYRPTEQVRPWTRRHYGED